MPTRSHLTLIDLNGNAEIIYSADYLFEAPNWSPDGEFLIINANRKLYRLPVSGGQPRLIPMDPVQAINNDHGISPDGKLLAISESGGPVYVMPIAGGTPRAVTPQRPSYFHSWSPDGRRVAFVARTAQAYDVYSCDIASGQPLRLTENPGHDDGPDYSPDGNWIYFNSDRKGGGHIFRIPASGAGADDRLAEQITFDDAVDWFPHPSPDGKWLVFLSYEPGTAGHPANRDVSLRLLPLADASAKDKPRELVRLFGGQGTINVNSWSPDSRRFAYVSYETI